MKRILYLLVICFSLSSCFDLDPEMYDVINPGIFPQNEADARAMVVASAYSPFRDNAYNGIFNSGNGIHVVSEMTTDAAICSWGSAVWSDLRMHSWTPSHEYIGLEYTRYAKNISAMTLTLERIKNVPMSEESRALMTAELRCGRGWLAFLLYDFFGPIPIPSLEQLQNPLKEEIVARPTKEWMVEFIETDLKEAAKVLPARVDASKYGSFTRGLANTVLMKLYMHEGRWADAVSVGRELMKGEYGYALMQDSYKDIFSLENEGNSEIIWASVCDRAGNMQNWMAHALPSQFPTKNPSISKWGGYKVPWAFYNTFEAGDKRLESIVGEYVGNDGVLYNQENPGSELQLGAIPVKVGEDPEDNGDQSGVDWVVYRYADVLTLLAEAIVRNGHTVTQEAVDLLNTVRIRAGIRSYVLSDFSGEEAFLDKVLLERGHELCFENCRRSDLIRHGKFIQYARDRGSVTTKEEYVLMPLPQSVIYEGKGIILQNPGY